MNYSRRYATQHKLKSHLLLTFIFSSSMLMTACTSLSSSKQAQNKPIAKTFTPSQISQDSANANVSKYSQEDVFKTGDAAEVTVHGFEDFSGIYIVGRQGKIHFLHIGDVEVAGRTITEIQNTLRQKYSQCCLKNPSISIKKESQLLGNITVDGAVTKPGAFEIHKIIKLSEAVALASGATIDANRQEVVLSRIIDNERRIMTVNLENIQLLGADDPLIYPNDVIFVPDNAGRLLFNDFVRTLPVISAIIFAFQRR